MWKEEKITWRGNQYIEINKCATKQSESKNSDVNKMIDLFFSYTIKKHFNNTVVVKVINNKRKHRTIYICDKLNV